MTRKDLNELMQHINEKVNKVNEEVKIITKDDEYLKDYSLAVLEDVDHQLDFIDKELDNIIWNDILS